MQRAGLTRRNHARIIRCCRFNKETHPEEHYREKLMLYTSWRHEEDLLTYDGTVYRSFAEAFEARKEDIFEVQKKI